MYRSIERQFSKLREERDSAEAHAELLSLELAKIINRTSPLTDRDKGKLRKLLARRKEAGRILYLRTLASLEQHLRESLLHDIASFRNILSERLDEREHRLLRLSKERVTSRLNY